MPEPWLRGILTNVDPAIGQLLRSAQQIREDLEPALRKLKPDELWNCSAGFHAKHLAGSTRRLCAYLAGRGLTNTEIAAIAQEEQGNETADELIDAVNRALDEYEKLLRALSPQEFGSIREVGRNRIPVTAIALAIHIAEHGQRHTGQAITAAKFAVAKRQG